MASLHSPTQNPQILTAVPVTLLSTSGPTSLESFPQKLQTVSGFLAMMVISVHIKVDSAQF
jgi:hypothetical protein